MPAHWSRAPAPPKKRGPRKPARVGAWRCHTCGETIRGPWKKAEDHADDHGGVRLDCVDTRKDS